MLKNTFYLNQPVLQVNSHMFKTVLGLVVLVETLVQTVTVMLMMMETPKF